MCIMERERLAPNLNTGPFIQFEEETEGDLIQGDTKLLLYLKVS